MAQYRPVITEALMRSKAYRQGRVDCAIALAEFDRLISNLRPSVNQREQWKHFLAEYERGWTDERICWIGR